MGIYTISMRSKVFQSKNYLKYFNHIWWKLHESGIGDSPINPINENPSSNSVSHRSKLGFLIRLPPCRGKLSGEGRRQPFTNFGWYRVRLYFGQFVIFVGQSSTENHRKKMLTTESTSIEMKTLQNFYLRLPVKKKKKEKN